MGRCISRLLKRLKTPGITCLIAAMPLGYLFDRFDRLSILRLCTAIFGLAGAVTSMSEGQEKTCLSFRSWAKRDLFAWSFDVFWLE